jgi:hypothetical protein
MGCQANDLPRRTHPATTAMSEHPELPATAFDSDSADRRTGLLADKRDAIEAIEFFKGGSEYRPHLCRNSGASIGSRNDARMIKVFWDD